MNQKGESFETIGRASRAAKISRDRLRDACDQGRIPHRRSASGYRLISRETVEILRRRGLDAFPPISQHPEPVPESDPSPRRSLSAEKLGLLGEPSARLRKLKESVESQRMRLEFENLSDELKEIKTERRQRAEEAKAEREARIQEEREEHEARLHEEAQATAAERRQKWFTSQAKHAIDLLYREAPWVPFDIAEHTEEITAALAETLPKELQQLGPNSPAPQVEAATRRIVEAILAPYKKAKNQEEVIESALRCIPSYLRELCDKGWLDCATGDVAFIAEQIREPMRTLLERESRLREISKNEAEGLIKNATDKRFQII